MLIFEKLVHSLNSLNLTRVYSSFNRFRVIWYKTELLTIYGGCLMGFAASQSECSQLYCVDRFFGWFYEVILKTLIFRPRFENKKLKKLEFTRVFHSILTRTQHLFTKFHKLATRTHSIFNLKTKTRHSYSLAVLLISTHSTLCKKLEIECGNSLTGFQMIQWAD